MQRTVLADVREINGGWGSVELGQETQTLRNASIPRGAGQGAGTEAAAGPQEGRAPRAGAPGRPCRPVWARRWLLRVGVTPQQLSLPPGAHWRSTNSNKPGRSQALQGVGTGGGGWRSWALHPCSLVCLVGQPPTPTSCAGRGCPAGPRLGALKGSWHRDFEGASDAQVQLRGAGPWHTPIRGSNCRFLGIYTPDPTSSASNTDYSMQPW